jgi:hypothetical protein
VTQKEGLVGSCPFLYAWNGERFEFVTDVLGITPLGLPIGDGRYVPPDHDELVRIEGRRLRPRDGELVMVLTEELREVTYLDRAQLWAVDHPAGVEVHPEERFTFPPFPPLRLHAVSAVLPLRGALGSDGRDWSRQLAAADGVHAVPFDSLEPQFLGLAKPHHLDILLPDAAREAKRVRLLMTGWFFWTEASVNAAAGQHPVHRFVPPTFLVPDSSGEFRESGPPAGFPAGKTKTMVIDVGGILNRDDPRLRIFSTLRLYWDAIRVAVNEDDAPIEIARIEPASARLHYRGFSQPLHDPRPDQPERFEFHRLRDPPWNQHPGMLTRYGDAAPLLGEIDDRFAIFSAGDAIELRFPARRLGEPAAGRARTYLLFLDGWAKDGDLNTTHGERVEPLPFHAMSGYPYGPGESYPDGEVHRAYRAEWNTRPGRRLIPELRQ